MVKTVTQGEREAALANSPELKNETAEQQDEDILELEELAAMYVSNGGQDPRALKIFQAARAAGRIDEKGNWVDEE